MEVGTGVMRAYGVTIDVQRAVDLDLPPGVQPDVTEHGEAPRRLARAGGTGPSNGDPGSGGRRTSSPSNTVVMAWDLMHLAAALKPAGGFPADGAQRGQWDAGSDFDHPHPEYR